MHYSTIPIAASITADSFPGVNNGGVDTSAGYRLFDALFIATLMGLRVANTVLIVEHGAVG